MKFLCALCVLCGLAPQAPALEREAFTFTRYNLTVRIEPEQQRIGVRGKITLRNDSQSPQKNLSLQISSTLHWSSIQVEGKPVDYSSQIYTSDIDHTGALTEAIVTLPKPLAPRQTIELEIGYEGVIPQDTTRLTRIGAPADIARHSDWDQISPSFTGVRGVGYVAWYPIATDAASLSEGDRVLETVGRWKQREAQAEMKIALAYSRLSSEAPLELLCNGQGPGKFVFEASRAQTLLADCSFAPMSLTVPVLMIGQYSTVERNTNAIAIAIHCLSGHKTSAENYALAVEEVAPFITKWFGDHRGRPELKAEILELPDPEAAPFESGNMLLMPFTVKDSTLLLSSIQQLTHVSFPSPRSWIYDGLAHYAQLSLLQERGGRQAVLDYLQSHKESLLASEKPIAPQSGNRPAEHSLINATDGFYVQTKAMNVWWMLRDILGETALHAALHNYKAADDKDAYYMQKLIETQAHRDLAWFFDDWVYRDRGLPDFHIASVYPRQLLSGGYMVTVMVENLGEAAAEVPVTLQMQGSEATQRLIVPGKSKASVRIQAASMPQQVTVNDGSVPESDMSNNSYKIDATAH